MRPPAVTRHSPVLTLLAGVTVLAVLAGCTSAVGERLAAADGEPVDGGTARVGTPNDLSPKTLYSGGGIAELTVTGNVFETLTKYDAEGENDGGELEPQPVLAESWDVSDDGTDVTVHLRDDVTFHNGADLDSGDVKASFENYSDPARSGQLARTAQQIERIDTPDPLTVDFTFAQAVNNVFDLFEFVPVIEASTIDGFNDGTAFVGTGPFSFDDWQRGSHLSLGAYEGYRTGAPAIDGIEVVVVPDSQTQFAQLRSGQLDVLPAVDPRDAEALEDNDLFDVTEKSGTGATYYTGMNVQAPTFRDRRVRQAVAYAVDRDRILDEVYQGRGYTQSLPWPADSAAYDEERNDTYQRDLDRARELVGQVEEEDGPLPGATLSYRGADPTEQNTAQIIRADLAEIGVTVDLQPLEAGVHGEKLRNAGFDGMWLLSHDFVQYTPATLTVSAFPFNSEHNTSNFRSDAYSAAAADAWLAGDPSSPAAQAAYRRLNDILLDEAFLVELIRPDAPLVTASNLKGVTWTKRSEPVFAHATFTS